MEGMKIWDWIGHIGEDRQARVQGDEREGGKKGEECVSLEFGVYKVGAR